MEKNKDVIGSLTHEVFKTGKILYEKKQNNVIELVKKWVKKADNDIITAENLLHQTL